MRRAYEVVVVGAGPVGLAVAHLLGQAGVSVLVVERRHDTSAHPRASGIHGRTMELFRQWGIADDIRKVAVPPELSQGFGWMTRLNGIELGRITFAGESDASAAHEPGPEPPCFCPQSSYEPVLLAAARRHDNVRVEFGCEAVSLDQDEAGVTVGVRQLDGSRIDEVRASFVVAADGAGSQCRQMLGITESGTGTFGHSLNAYFRADLGHYVRDKPLMLLWIVNADTQGTIGAASCDGTRWTYNFDAAPERSYSNSEIVEQVRMAVGDAALEVDIIEVLRWDYDQAVADNWRVGRVLLAGDAAHRLPPHGAFGMNSGMQDAVNLAWKLTHVLRGTAGWGLLDSYEAERKPVAFDNCMVALSNTRKMAETGWHGLSREELSTIEDPSRGAQLRRRISAAIADQQEHLHSEGQQFGTIYASGAVVPDGSPAPASTVSHYLETGHPGARAPHLWLRESTGGRLSTLDLWNGGFVLLAGPDEPAWFAAASQLSVAGHRIGHGGPLVEEDRRWGDVYEVGASGAVLVRPDGHVGARFSQRPHDPSAALAGALDAILHTGASPGLEPTPSMHSTETT